MKNKELIEELKNQLGRQYKLTVNVSLELHKNGSIDNVRHEWNEVMRDTEKLLR